MEATCKTEIYNYCICCGNLGIITVFVLETPFFKKTGESFIFVWHSVACISCPLIFARWFTFIGELEKLSVRLKIALRQVKMILPGLRSEEMEKEKNTRENKSQSNVNTGRTERSCLSPRRKPENIFCCQKHLDRTRAPVKAIHLPIVIQPFTACSSIFVSLAFPTCISIILPKPKTLLDFFSSFLHLKAFNMQHFTH